MLMNFIYIYIFCSTSEVSLGVTVNLPTLQMKNLEPVLVRVFIDFL